MRSAKFLTPSVLALCLPLFGCEREVSFANDIQPILNIDCVECHGGTAEGAATSGVDLTSYEGVMKGTNFGSIVVPGNSASSVLYQVVAHTTSPEIHMPPHHEDALAEGRGFTLKEDEVQAIADWIDQGAANN
ncbi:MAG: hypothetical protein QNI99_21210 [Woeseiaceae bacterium]|nr:hypothetical protein [Woeseiaceae bacterium]